MNIISSSSALISSWMFLEELGICFDAGDGLCAGLGLKSRKIKHVFVSHADRDHLAGLLQFNALNGTTKPVIHYPADCGSFPALRDFCAAFDPHTGQSDWQPMQAGDEVEVGKGVFVRALRSNHVQKDEQHKSLAFVVLKRQPKLRREFAGQDVAALRQSVADEALFDVQERPLFGYSGDGEPEAGLWAGVEVIAHECTFVTDEDKSNARSRHSGLSETLAMLAELRPAAALLYHFSPRYSTAEIEAAVEVQKARLGIAFPVHLILPGSVCRITV